VLVEGADQDLVVPENIDLPAGGNDLGTGSGQLIMIMKILEKWIGLRNVVTVGVFLPETPVHSLPTQHSFFDLFRDWEEQRHTYHRNTGERIFDTSVPFVFDLNFKTVYISPG
jgi:hypothetical protein